MTCHVVVCVLVTAGALQLLLVCADVVHHRPTVDVHVASVSPSVVSWRRSTGEEQVSVQEVDVCGELVSVTQQDSVLGEHVKPLQCRALRLVVYGRQAPAQRGMHTALLRRDAAQLTTLGAQSHQPRTQPRVLPPQSTHVRSTSAAQHSHTQHRLLHTACQLVCSICISNHCDFH